MEVQQSGPDSADTKRAPMMTVVIRLVRCTKSEGVSV